MTPRRTVAVTLALATAVTAPACATTYDESEAPTVPVVTTTTLPSGPPAELLGRLVAEAAPLGTMIDEHRSGTRPTLAHIEVLWQVVRPDVERTHPQLVEDLDANVARCRAAVERNRPADADKAYRNLRALVASYDPG